ncbi:delta-lactam-biosynthetic de-N-acetylase [Paenibacillus sp. TRM 82003]|nr:delta-lactam-biosynthetic de-N-acetylase [Paenibacillus sp. TRM 82003]
MRRSTRIAGLVLAVAALLGGIVPGAAADADTPHNFGFKKSRNGAPASIDQEPFRPLVDKYDAIFIGDAEKKSLYLTFDNGYENGFTAQILDVLKAKKVPAIFFVTGQYLEEQPELLKRMAAEGHLIGNHSWSHPDMTAVSDERIKNELDRVKQGVAAVTGQKDMLFLRPPRGVFSERTLSVSQNMGYVNVFWSVAYVDWETKRQKGKAHAFEQVTKQLHPGAVILLHSVSKDNAEAMGDIIDYARKQGYEFRSLEELIVPTP